MAWKKIYKKNKHYKSANYFPLLYIPGYGERVRRMWVYSKCVCVYSFCRCLSLLWSHTGNLCCAIVLFKAPLFQVGEGAGIASSEHREAPNTPWCRGELLWSGAAHPTTHRSRGNITLHGGCGILWGTPKKRFKQSHPSHTHVVHPMSNRWQCGPIKSITISSTVMSSSTFTATAHLVLLGSCLHLDGSLQEHHLLGGQVTITEEP